MGSLQCLLIPNPKDRLSAEQIEEYIHTYLINQNPVSSQIHIRSLSTNEKMNKEILTQRNENYKSNQLELIDFQHPSSSSLSTKFVKLVSKVAQKTDFWVAACLEEVDAAPNQKYFRYLHVKAWYSQKDVFKNIQNFTSRSILNYQYDSVQKKPKIPKFYEKLSNRLQLNSVIITFKALQLLHNYLKKGPQEALIVNNQNSSPLAVLEKIKIFQETSMTKPSKDKFRSQFFTNLLYSYSVILIEKVKFHKYYLKYFEGNFAMVPFFNNMNSKDKLKLSIAILNNLNNLWKQFNTFINSFQFQKSSLFNLQLGFAITMADELYNILCIAEQIKKLIFIWVGIILQFDYFNQLLKFILKSKTVINLVKILEKKYIKFIF